MVVLTDSGEHLHEGHAMKERQAVFHESSLETNAKNSANRTLPSKRVTDNEDDTVSAKHVDLNNSGEINSVRVNHVNEISDGSIAAGDLQEVHDSSKPLQEASEPLLKHRANSFNLQHKETPIQDECLENTEENTRTLTSTDEKDLPIDKGWAWVILLASVYTHFIIIGQLKCFGIVFVQLQQRYGSSSSATSIIFTLMNASYSVSALVIMTIGGSLSARTSVFIGAIISSVASMITAFIYNVNVAMVTIGIAGGVANAFVMPLVATIISTYFVDKRGFANNVGNCGVSLGAIALAPIITKLFETYSYTGTYIILTGFNLQMFVIASLLRPMSFYRRRPSFLRSGSNGKDTATDESKGFLKKTCNGNTGSETDPRSFLKTRLAGKHPGNAFKGIDGHPSETVDRPSIQARRRRTVSESETGNALKPRVSELSSVHSLFNSTLDRFVSTDVMNNSMMDLTLTEGEPKANMGEKNVNNTTSDSRTHKQTFKRTIINSLKKLFDMKLLSKPEFQYFLACNAFLCGGCSLASAFLPPLAYENGVSNDMVALLVSIMSIVEFCSRFVFGYISDKKWCHRSTLIAIATFILGVAAQFLHFMTTFSTILIYAVIAGLLQGVYFALFVVVILDILDFDDFKGALGFTSLIQGIASGVCLPIVGYLRDNTGHYTYPYNFIGAILIIGAVLTYFIPNVHELSIKRSKEKIKNRNV